MPVTLRKMVPGDVSGAILLSRAAGWNQTEKDWLFLINSPGHLSMVAEVHHDNVLDQLSHVKVIKLDATPQGQLVYKGFGFLETN